MKPLISFEPFKLLSEATRSPKGNMMVRGVLQRAETLNQNGRIYPRHILEREVRNYQKLIAENRALGECVPPGTEIYTKTGWKNIEDIAEDEVIFTLDTATNETHLQRISRKVVMPFDGELLRFYNARSYDMCLTPNHKMLIWDRAGKPKTILAHEMREAFEVKKDLAVKQFSLMRVNTSSKTADTILKNIVTKLSGMKSEKIPYKGDVFCVTVPAGTWLMRYNGKACWTHNCDHPETSVVELKNVSHIIREAVMDGNTVTGTLEILPTPAGKILEGLFNSGVTIGISSRGVGSTKDMGDHQIVQDDFQLICFDAVSEPSTPLAFLRMIESKNHELVESDLRKVFTKSDRINRALNDVLFKYGK